uniref:Uncharacterized protein n=1 Tax=Candidatus Kentrum sp. MB TaxID=2138164 RepID=A0A450XSY7_9GAMM|nr:MAG: hypothetical protein BECKMB1821I_GA0114274_102833 [Candidatus Kentron sp. MB]VFK32414.1 MAG: hypothetical protein BECKMB1821G_GA0114241_11118 [Candidatus Kentron sp. MB]VFK76193.1 MAG: hypothetical protein BECKMB1821H_GA0114242_104525 [Candidatus Kentron sp. MB]
MPDIFRETKGVILPANQWYLQNRLTWIRRCGFLRAGDWSLSRRILNKTIRELENIKLRRSGVRSDGFGDDREPDVFAKRNGK